MHDDSLHPHHELASAYLDGDLAEVERAQVHASPELTELVASFRTLRSGVADVAPPAASQRDAAIAAALAEFDTLQAAPGADDATATGQATTHIAPVLSLAARRKRMYTFISAAAAVLLVGVVGMSVLKNAGSGDDESAAVTSSKDFSAESNSAGAPAEVTGDRVASTIGSIGGDQVVTVALQIDDPAGLAALPLPAADADGGTQEATADSMSVEPGASDTLGTTETMLAPTASYFRPAMACLGPNQVFLADIIYQGTLAIAVRDTVTGVTTAIDDNCTVLATAP
ncbi:MAG: hypothetical protein Q7V88_01700 [Actinomycetota bacterium]|nr:hypothetical protein [Actinomycetota bacterium]